MSTTPTAFEPFTFEFDMHDEQHCVWRAEGAVDALPDDVDDGLPGRLLGCESLDQADRLLSELAEHRDDLDAALDTLRRCQFGCDCGSIAWESECDWIDELLERLDVLAWQVVVHDRTSYAWIEDLTVSRLFDLIPWRRNGWTRVKVEVSTDRVVATFAGYPCSATTVTLRPLYGPHLQLYVLASDMVDLPDDLLEVADLTAQGAIDLYEHVDDVLNGDIYGELDVVLAHVRNHGPLTSRQLDTLQALMPDWDQDLASLLQACTMLVVP